jgi:RNA polymerase sigma-70 factor (ECF subfamily)
MTREIPSSDGVTQLLRAVRAGDRQPADQLIEIVYQELRRLAAALMRKERRGHSLPSTALVHEVYLRLVHGSIAAESQAHFYAIAARSMRQIMVDYARRRMAVKRPARSELRMELQENTALKFAAPEEVLAVHEALEKLASLDPRQAEILEMAYFSGSSVHEIAGYFNVSGRTIKRELQTGRLLRITPAFPSGNAGPRTAESP